MYFWIVSMFRRNFLWSRIYDSFIGFFNFSDYQGEGKTKNYKQDSYKAMENEHMHSEKKSLDRTLRVIPVIEQRIHYPGQYTQNAGI
jgi:hypothetical protein